MAENMLADLSMDFAVKILKNFSNIFWRKTEFIGSFSQIHEMDARRIIEGNIT